MNSLILTNLSLFDADYIDILDFFLYYMKKINL